MIVDPKGVERVRIGGQLPDATPGKPRGQDVAGVLLYDATGRERSGYVTFEPSGNVGLTLDGRQGQSMFFVAGPTGATALRMWRGTNWRTARSALRVTEKPGHQVRRSLGVTFAAEPRGAQRVPLSRTTVS